MSVSIYYSPKSKFIIFKNNPVNLLLYHIRQTDTMWCAALITSLFHHFGCHCWNKTSCKTSSCNSAPDSDYRNCQQRLNETVNAKNFFLHPQSVTQFWGVLLKFCTQTGESKQEKQARHHNRFFVKTWVVNEDDRWCCLVSNFSCSPITMLSFDH